MANSGTRTVTVLVSDLVGSTQQRSRLGDTAADLLRQDHDRILDDAIAAFGGTRIKGLGDGVLAVFDSASDAIESAVRMQQGTHAHRGDDQLLIRVGLSVGDVSFEDGDVFGTPVVAASRLCADASGGQILCSDLVRGLAGSRVSCELRPAGERSLKGLDDPLLTHEVVWSPAPGPRLPLPPFLAAEGLFVYVGRGEEREALQQAWKLAQSGTVRSVLLAGEPGVGKTRLAAELASQIHADGAVVVGGRCDEEVGSAYQPVVEALRRVVSHTDPDDLPDWLGPHGGDLTRLLPELAHHADRLPPALQADAELERARLLDAIRVWLETMADAAPVLLVLDDLHWADRATVLVLRHLVRTLHERRVMILATYRDTDVDRAHPLSEALADLRRERSVERVALKGLSQEEVLTFLEAAAGSHQGERTDELAAALHRATEGNPFFLEEVVRHLVETGRIYERDGVWTSDVDSVDELGIPEGIREVVGRRLSHLGGSADAVLARAAVVGPEFTVAALEWMHGDDDAVLATLERAEAAGLLREGSGRAAGYSFAHALVRQTLLEELSLARRQRFHLQAAEALEATGGTSGAVALHYRQAGAAAEPERAVAASLLAAEEARQQYAWDEATAHWEAAVQLLEDTGGEAAEQARLLERIGDAMYASEVGWEEGIEHLERARSIYEALGMELEAAKVRSRIGRSLATFPGRQDTARAMENFRAALAVLDEDTPSVTLGYVYLGFASVLAFSMDPERCREFAGRALKVAEAIHNETMAINATLLDALALAAMGFSVDHVFDEAHARAVELGHPILTWLAAFTACTHSEFHLDPKATVEWANRELGSGRHAQAPGLRSALLTERWICLGYLGRLDEMESSEAQIPSVVREGGMVDRWRGDFIGAVESLARVREHTQRMGNVSGAGMLLVMEGEAWERAGEPERAEQRFAAVADLFPEPELMYFLALPDLRRAILLARQDRAEEAAPLVRHWEERCRPPRDVRGITGFLHLAHGLVTASAAPAAFQAAVDSFRGYELPFYEAEVFEDWGRVTGRVEHLDAALAIYERLGVADGWGERGRRLRASLA